MLARDHLPRQRREPQLDGRAVADRYAHQHADELVELEEGVGGEPAVEDLVLFALELRVPRRLLTYIVMALYSHGLYILMASI